MNNENFCNHSDDSYEYELLSEAGEFLEKDLSRRTFLKRAGILGLGAISLPLLNAKDAFAAQSTISVVNGHSEAKMVEKSINLLGGMKKFVKRGDVVMLKPNIGWARTYKQAANTNPFVIQKLIEMCYNAGAKKVRVTDNPCQSASITFSRSGIKRACKKAGAELVYPSRSRFKTMNIGGRVVRKWPVYVDIVECDKLINVPVAKHHSLSRLTLGMKNFYGCLGGNRGRLHQNIHAGITDMARFFKPDLTVIDAVRIMIRNGPTGGSYRDVKKTNTIITGKDFVACDAYASTLFGLTPNHIGYVKLAGKYGLGQNNLSKIKTLKASV